MNTEQIGIRIPEAVNVSLTKKAQDIGVSKNALILVLIDLGSKVYEASGSIKIAPCTASNSSTHACTANSI